MHDLIEEPILQLSSFSNLISCIRIDKHQTTVYNPHCNKPTECQNTVPITIMSLYVATNVSDWDRFAPFAAFCINISLQEKYKRIRLLFNFQSRHSPISRNCIRSSQHQNTRILLFMLFNCKRIYQVFGCLSRNTLLPHKNANILNRPVYSKFRGVNVIIRPCHKLH